ncbi:MAG TPA: response regulator [Bellilinea sp.]|nr:response regulator [Bellilinea sp.]
MSVKRVLIVDDAYELGRMLRAAVETLGAGLDVNLVPSAEEALLEHARQPLDLLVVDIRLPGMSGLDLTRRLRERGSTMKILLITGMPDKDIPAKATAVGADRFMPKPFLMSEFLAVTGELLGLQPPALEQPHTQPAVDVPPVTDLPGVLQGLRKSLGAALVLLADDRGKVVAQTGLHTELEFDQQWATTILASLSALQKASRLVNSGMPQGAMVLRGPEQQLIAAPVGDYALVIGLGADKSGLRSALALEEALTAQAQLVRILDQTGVDFRAVPAVSTSPSASTAALNKKSAASPRHSVIDTVTKAHVKSTSKPPVEETPPPLKTEDKPLPSEKKPAVKEPTVTRAQSVKPVEKPEKRAEKLPVVPAFESTENLVGPFTDYSEETLQALVEQSEKTLGTKKADEYWDQAVTDTPAMVESPDVLTFEEAQQLGLTPETE